MAEYRDSMANAPDAAVLRLHIRKVLYEECKRRMSSDVIRIYLLGIKSKKKIAGDKKADFLSFSIYSKSAAHTWALLLFFTYFSFISTYKVTVRETHGIKFIILRIST